MKYMELDYDKQKTKQNDLCSLFFWCFVGRCSDMVLIILLFIFQNKFTFSQAKPSEHSSHHRPCPAVHSTPIADANAARVGGQFMYRSVP